MFDSTSLSGMVVRNRLVRSATWEGLAGPDGKVTTPLIDIYRRLAEGGVGLIISSYIAIRTDCRQFDTQITADRDELIPGLARLAEAVHERGGVIAGQIVHCGGQANRRATNGQAPAAPSAVASPGYAEIPRELTTDDVTQLIEVDFPQAARRLKAAGFDGVQLHGAHGYLLAQFLSPLCNQRTDRFGGSLENRARFALEVYRAVRDEVGASFPVMIKLNSNDFLDGSTTEKDSTYLASALAEAGIDAIEVSGGTPGSGKLGAVRNEILTPDAEAYFLPQARAIRAAAPDVPLMLVGGLRSLEKIEAVLAAGDADYIAMSRPLIREPDLPARWQNGDRTRAACISCSGCFGPATKGLGIRCIRTDEEGGS